MHSDDVEAHCKTLCEHCGNNCTTGAVRENGMDFCCNGCRLVYNFLNEQGLDSYYSIAERPGNSQREAEGKDLAYLDDPALQEKLLDYSDDAIARLRVSIPGIHCASCVWLLEQLHKLDGAIVKSEINFLRKELSITFRRQDTRLSAVVDLLRRIGYPPDITLNNVRSAAGRNKGKDSSFLKMGVAGFCFGNIMLFSFPEYLAGDAGPGTEFSILFSGLNLLLSLPVLFYSAGEFFRAAWQGLRNRQINIDVPIALGISVLFLRSVWNIFVLGTPGYLDSLAALVFLLLVGRWFQRKTFDSLSFDRDYASYFPLAVTVCDGDKCESRPLENLKVGDELLLRNGELIPADCRLTSASCAVDYSFVTGEAEPVQRSHSQLLYAGGKVVGGAVRMVVTRAFSQSYLTDLWNNDVFSADKTSRFQTLTNRFSKYFTAAIILIALTAGLAWLRTSPAMAMDSVTATLIVACPCALALAAPFTLGSALNILARRRFFVRNAAALERLAATSTLVFDKTGTLTEAGSAAARYHGRELTKDEGLEAGAAIHQSNHPLSRSVAGLLPDGGAGRIVDMQEFAGEGVSCLTADGRRISFGSHAWFQRQEISGTPLEAPAAGGIVCLAINGVWCGWFDIVPQYRSGVRRLIEDLRRRYAVYLLSGDGTRHKAVLAPLFGSDAAMHFHQSPHDKLAFLKNLQAAGQRCVMIGDGLNDAGALQQADVGIALVEQRGGFTPASDGILEAGRLPLIPDLLRYARRCSAIVKLSIGISLLYNVVGLSLAVQGLLSPLISAILMPLSSISVIAFTTIAATLAARRIGGPL